MSIIKTHDIALYGEDDTPDSLRAKKEYHCRLTRDEYINNRRFKVSADKIFELPIADIKPSQLYISEGKLRLVNEWFDPTDKTEFDPIPIKRYNNSYLMTDGHTRAVAAILAGWDTVPVTWDDDPLDMLAYAVYVKWCDDEKICSAYDLTKRIIPHKDYEVLWLKRCFYMENS